MKPSLRPWFRTWRLSLALASFCGSLVLAGPPDQGDVFAIIGVSPEQAALEMPRSIPFRSAHSGPRSASPWVGMPMPESRRAAFIAALKAAHPRPDFSNPVPFECLLDLLEESGRYEDALRLIPDEGIPGLPHLLERKAVFLWKAGRADDAAKLVREIGAQGRWLQQWHAPLGVDLALNRPESAIRTLDFILRELPLESPGFRLVAATQVELAIRSGAIDGLLGEPVPFALRAGRLFLAGRGDALEAEFAAVPPQEIDESTAAALISVIGLQPRLTDRVRELLAAPTVPQPEVRAALLNAIRDSAERLGHFLDMATGHAEVLPLILPRLEAFEDPQRFIPGCNRLVEKLPGNPWPHLLRARCENDRGDLARHHLKLAVRLASSDEAHDPAGLAIGKLVSMCDAAELDEIITSAPGFGELDPARRFELLRAARLDFRVVGMIEELSFSEPGHDPLSLRLANYLQLNSQGRAVPAGVVDLVIRRLPELCLGSTEKPTAAVGSGVIAWFRWLDGQKVEPAALAASTRRLAEGLKTRGVDLPGLAVMEIPFEIREAAGIGMTAKNPSAAGPNPHSIPVWWRTLCMFAAPTAPSQLSAHMMQTHPSMGGGLLRFDQIPQVGLLAASPWVTAVESIIDAARIRPAEIALAAKLRRLLPEDSPRAAVFDVLVATGVVACDDEGIKALAGRRAAALAAANPPHEVPEIQCYLFLSRLYAAADPGTVVPGLPDFSRHSPMTRRRLAFLVRGALLRFGRNPAVAELLLSLSQEQGVEPDARPAAPPKVSDYDRLIMYRDSERSGSPEALALAEKVLDAATEPGVSETGPTFNIAIHILVTEQRFADYVKRRSESLRVAGRSELEIQRALFRLHSYHIIHSKGEALPFAKRIFELDPTDPEAAQAACHAAVSAGDGDTAMRCLLALAASSHEAFQAVIGKSYPSQPPAYSPLRFIEGERASEFFAKLAEVPPPVRNRTDPAGDSSFAMTLLGHVLEHAPEHFDAMAAWSESTRMLSSTDCLVLAEQIRRAGDSGRAVRFLAANFFRPDTADRENKHRFRSLESAKPRLDLPVFLLEKGGWLEPLAAVAAGITADAANEWTLLLIRLAAEPTRENWDRLAVPALAAAPVSQRDELRRQLEVMITALPTAAALKTSLAVAAARDAAAPANLDSLRKTLEELAATDAPERAALASALWTRAVTLLNEDADVSRRIRFLQTSLAPIARCADDSLWKAYLERVSGEEGFTLAWPRSAHGDEVRGVDPRRLMDFIALVLDRETPSGEPRAPITTAFTILAHSNRDVAQLARFRPWLDGPGTRSTRTDPAVFRFLELTTGGAEAALPSLVAEHDGDGCRFQWSLASHAGSAGARPFGRRFAFLDGRFDLSILAGPEPDRLSVVARVPSAASVGEIHLKLPEDASHAAVLAVDRDGGDIVRVSETVKIVSRVGWVDLEFDHADPSPDSATLDVPSDGPFGGGEVAVFAVPPQTDLVLARLPWEEGPVPDVSLWTCDDSTSRSGKWMLRYLDDTGSEVGSAGVRSSDLPGGMPLWDLTEFESKSHPPARATRVELIYRNSGASWPVTVRATAARMRPRPAAVLPPGIERIVRVPENLDRIAIDPAGERLVLAAPERGVRVFDIAGSSLGDWIPLPATSKGETAACRWLAIGGNHVLHSDGGNRNFLIHLETREVRRLDGLWPVGRHFDPAAVSAFSPNGRFLAHSMGMAGLRLVHIAEDGTLNSRVLETGRLGHISFNMESTALVTHDMGREWRLPLGDWQNAMPQAASKTRASVPPKPLQAAHGGSGRIDHIPLELVFRSADSPEAYRFQPVDRRLFLPQGMALPGGLDTLWFVSGFGTIHRITISRLEGTPE